MIKKIALLCFAVCFCGVLFAQEDPVVMTINGEPVTRSEFEYSYNKNNNEKVLDKKSLDEYVQLFINYKLKVADAKALHLDTLTSFINEFNSYRDQQAESYLIDEDFIEEEAQKIYEQTKQNIGEQGMIRVSHILVHLAQDATSEMQTLAKAKIDSIHQCLSDGADFQALALVCSDDKASAQQGSFWVQRNRTIKEFENVVFALQDGEMSQPFLTPIGYHIAIRYEHKSLGTYEENRENIISFLYQRGIIQLAKNNTGKKIAEKMGNGITPEAALAMEDSLLEQKYPEFKNLMREYYDGLLLFEISNRRVWEYASQDEEGQNAYFKANKKKYRYDSPRFKGIVAHCLSQEVLNKLQKRLKKERPEEYLSVIRAEFNNDSIIQVKVEQGPFKQGDNKWIDKLVFDAHVQGDTLKGFPVVAVIGKKLKKKPETYKDVQGQIISDYQNYLEEQWIKELRSKYSVVIDEEVLKTINNHS